MSLRELRHRGDLLDRALLLWLPGPKTATGEDVAEFHLHGGRAVVAAVIAALASQPGLREAEPGEFTRRALDHGRIDLTEAEGLADLLAAETDGQRRAALRLAGGALARRVEGWRKRVLGLAARVEAQLDFEEEPEVAALDDGWRVEAAALADEMRSALAAPTVERLRDGVRVVIAGPPNSGKSTLLNALAGRDAAIVSPAAGTTRDLIEAPVAIGGTAFLLTDTAGLHEATDAVEKIGIARARAAVEAADLVLWLGEPANAPSPALALHARTDLPGREQAPAGAVLAVSAVTGTGLHALRDMLLDRARSLLPAADEVALNARHHAALSGATGALEAAQGQSDLLLTAEELRSARAALDRVTGRAGIEDMLDTLFAGLCIGK